MRNGEIDAAPTCPKQPRDRKSSQQIRELARTTREFPRQCGPLMKPRDAALATKHKHFYSQEILEDHLPTHEYIQQFNGLSDRELAITTDNADLN